MADLCNLTCIEERKTIWQVFGQIFLQIKKQLQTVRLNQQKQLCCKVTALPTEPPHAASWTICLNCVHVQKKSVKYHSKKIGLDVMQIHPLRRMRFGQYQLDFISCAGVTGRWGLPSHTHVYNIKLVITHSNTCTSWTERSLT